MILEIGKKGKLDAIVCSLQDHATGFEASPAGQARPPTATMYGELAGKSGDMRWQPTVLSAAPIGSCALKAPNDQWLPPSPEAPNTVVPRTPITLKAVLIRSCCAFDAYKHTCRCF